MIFVSDAVVSDALLSCSSLTSGSQIKLARHTGTPLKAATAATVELLTGLAKQPDTVVTLAVKSLLDGLRFLRTGMELSFSCRGEHQKLLVKELSTAEGTVTDTFETIVFASRDCALKFRTPSSGPSPGATSAPNVGIVNSKIDFSFVGGLDEQIGIIRDAVQAPLTDPSRFTRFGIRPPRGVLLTGPSGTGKTLLARAVAGETGAHVVSVKGGDLMSKYYGETESRLRSIFEEAVERQPSIVFIDEIDTLCAKRDDSSSELDKRIVASLLTLMDGIAELGAKPGAPSADETPKVVVIGATNRPGALDEALRRPGRFDRELELPIPTPRARLDILKVVLRKVPTELVESDLEDLASKTHGYVGADLASLVREAGLRAVKRHAQTPGPGIKITLRDINEAFAMIRPSAMREILLEVPKVKWEDIGGQVEVKQKMREAIEWPLTVGEGAQNTFSGGSLTVLSISYSTRKPSHASESDHQRGSSSMARLVAAKPSWPRRLRRNRGSISWLSRDPSYSVNGSESRKRRFEKCFERRELRVRVLFFSWVVVGLGRLLCDKHA